MSQSLHVVCPHCDTVNRMPRAKLPAGGCCGACHQPLFEGRPLAIDGARFARHLEQSDIPLLIDFWAPWCEPCHAMAPGFERAARRLEPGVRLVKVNVDQEPALAEEFGVRSIPTLVLTLRGREINRIVGARSEVDLVSWVLRQPAVVASG